MNDVARLTSNAALPDDPEITDPAELRLRDALRNFPPAVSEAIRRFRDDPQPELLPLILNNLIERYVSPDLRDRLGSPADNLLLEEHLGLDSLTLMEIVMRLEDVFPITIHDEEFRQVRTLGDLRDLINRHTAKLTLAKAS